MTNCEKAIEILQRTHDGDDLAPQHLKLVELAVNDMVTEVGQAAFEQLYTADYRQHVCAALGSNIPRCRKSLIRPATGRSIRKAS